MRSMFGQTVNSALSWSFPVGQYLEFVAVKPKNLQMTTTTTNGPDVLILFFSRENTNGGIYSFV